MSVLRSLIGHDLHALLSYDGAASLLGNAIDADAALEAYAHAAERAAWLAAGLNPFGERARVDAYAKLGIEALAMMTVSDMLDESGGAVRISDDELKRGVDQMMRLACRVAVS